MLSALAPGPYGSAPGPSEARLPAVTRSENSSPGRIVAAISPSFASRRFLNRVTAACAPPNDRLRAAARGGGPPRPPPPGGAGGGGGRPGEGSGAAEGGGGWGGGGGRPPRLSQSGEYGQVVRTRETLSRDREEHAALGIRTRTPSAFP